MTKTRIASPAILSRALTALLDHIDQKNIAPERKALWHNAATKAYNQLFEGVAFVRHEDGTISFPSRTRSGLAHHVNGTCECEACVEQGNPCWHRAAKWMIERIETGQQAHVVTPASLHCPICAAPMLPSFTPGGERCYECSSSQCQKVIMAELAALFV